MTGVEMHEPYVGFTEQVMVTTFTHYFTIKGNGLDEEGTIAFDLFSDIFNEEI